MIVLETVIPGVGWIEDPTGTSSNVLQSLEFGRVGDEFLLRIGGLLVGAIGGVHGWSCRGEGLQEGPGRVAPQDNGTISR